MRATIGMAAVIREEAHSVLRKDTREEAGRVLAKLKVSNMQITKSCRPKAARVRDKLTRENAGIPANDGMELWAQMKGAAGQVAAGK